MNGAELPGGTTLSVEPSHSNQNRATTTAMITSPNNSDKSLSLDKLAAASTLPKQDADLPLPNGSAADADKNGHHSKSDDDNDDDDDDLNGFFSSL